MFGIFYILYDITMKAVGNAYNNYKDKKSKELTKNYQTNTYIDNHGCTRDLDTNEYRNITHRWNSEKRRYERIIYGSGSKIVKNITEEEEIKKFSNDWKIRADYEYEHLLPSRGSYYIPIRIYKEFYRPKDSDDVMFLTEFRIHREVNKEPQKIKVWFMPYKFKIYKIETSEFNDVTIEMLNKSIEKDEKGLNGSGARYNNEHYYIRGGDLWLYKKK